jgi:hypothetical protein
MHVHLDLEIQLCCSCLGIFLCLFLPHESFSVDGWTERHRSLYTFSTDVPPSRHSYIVVTMCAVNSGSFIWETSRCNSDWRIGIYRCHMMVLYVIINNYIYIMTEWGHDEWQAIRTYVTQRRDAVNYIWHMECISDLQVICRSNMPQLLRSYYLDLAWKIWEYTARN